MSSTTEEIPAGDVCVDDSSIKSENLKPTASNVDAATASETGGVEDEPVDGQPYSTTTNTMGTADSPLLSVRTIPGKGRGVFAMQDMPRGTVIEQAPCIAFPPAQYQFVKVSCRGVRVSSVARCAHCDRRGSHCVILTLHCSKQSWNITFSSRTKRRMRSS